MQIVQVGIDDTDSKKGMCTTYVGAVAIDRLKTLGVKILEHPKLIRLNPNWKLKTRGNCAVAFAVKAPDSIVPEVKKTVLDTVKELAELDVETTNPGVVFLNGEEVPTKLRDFSKKVVQDVVELSDAESMAHDIGAEIHKFKLGRGIIGALAAIGNTLEQDWTFELVTYRTPEHRGKKRRVAPASVVEMDAKTSPETFDNLDPASGEIRITPHTPCPILYGIRGENPAAVKRAHKMIKASEPIERFIIYRTNQGTDEHLVSAKITEARPYLSVIVDGVVCKAPKIILGGHVIFRLSDNDGEIDCAAYEPTRQFREVVKELIVGDKVRACGGIKEKPELPLTINLEKIEVLELAPQFKLENPICPSCGKHMKSEGRGKGYSCKRCRAKAPPDSPKKTLWKRKIKEGAFEVPPRARRHLARPLVRSLQVKFPPREF
ncbi:MAG: tRNA(Ile)(2)-agmatinylcytidine synthase [Candidatus Hadarchaeota archaeon]